MTAARAGTIDCLQLCCCRSLIAIKTGPASSAIKYKLVGCSTANMACSAGHYVVVSLLLGSANAAAVKVACSSTGPLHS